MKQSSWHILTALSYISLITVMTLQAVNSSQWLESGLLGLPLLILLPGILTSHHRAYTWLCFVVLVYFCFYTSQVNFSPPNWLMWSGLVASIVLFVSAMMMGRCLQKPAATE